MFNESSQPPFALRAVTPISVEVNVKKWRSLDRPKRRLVRDHIIVETLKMSSLNAFGLRSKFCTNLELSNLHAEILKEKMSISEYEDIRIYGYKLIVNGEEVFCFRVYTDHADFCLVQERSWWNMILIIGTFKKNISYENVAKFVPSTPVYDKFELLEGYEAACIVTNYDAKDNSEYSLVQGRLQANKMPNRKQLLSTLVQRFNGCPSASRKIGTLINDLRTERFGNKKNVSFRIGEFLFSHEIKLCATLLDEYLAA